MIVEEVTAVASETTDHENCRTGVSKDHQQSPLPVSDDDPASRREANDVPPLLDPSAQKSLQAQLESVRLVTKEDQVIRTVHPHRSSYTKSHHVSVDEVNCSSVCCSLKTCCADNSGQLGNQDSVERSG